METHPGLFEELGRRALHDNALSGVLRSALGTMASAGAAAARPVPYFFALRDRMLFYYDAAAESLADGETANPLGVVLLTVADLKLEPTFRREHGEQCWFSVSSPAADWRM